MNKGLTPSKQIKEFHGQTKTRLYKIYNGMKKRCYNKNCPSYRLYGQRGISICQGWLDSFIAFRNWSLDNGYKDYLTIDRIEVNGNYCPENCAWKTIKEQSNNTRYNIFSHIKSKL